MWASFTSTGINTRCCLCCRGEHQQRRVINTRCCLCCRGEHQQRRVINTRCCLCCRGEHQQRRVIICKVQENDQKQTVTYTTPMKLWGAVAEWVRTLGNLSVGLATSWSWVRNLLRQLRFGTLAIPLTLHCLCLSEETLFGPFYLVSMPGPEEVKDPTTPHWNV